MQGSKYVWLDGELVAWKDAKIHVMSHSLHYGDAAFEGIRFYETKKGSAVFRLKDHVDRLLFSANVFRMNVPYSKEEIVSAIKSTIRKNGLRSGYIRPILFFGEKMGLDNTGLDVHFAVITIPWGSYLGEEAVNVKTSAYVRLHPKTTNTYAKISGHYVNSILASVEVKKVGYQEALLLDYKGFVAEGPGENFFIVKKGVFYTPKLGNILPGITRASVIRIANDLGIKTVEKDIKLKEVYNADEAFFTGTAAEVTPIKSIDDKKMSGKSQSTKKIKEIFDKAVRGKDPKYLDWLDFVYTEKN